MQYLCIFIHIRVYVCVCVRMCMCAIDVKKVDFLYIDDVHTNI